MAIQGGGIEAYLDLNTGKFDSKLKQAQGQMDGLANTLKARGSQISNLGGELTKKVSIPLIGIGGAALQVGMNFEQGMSQVEAISGATGDDLAMLEGLARDMGATTKFSASEAAEGLTYMAMAGWKAEEMATALPAVLDLAAASGADLGITSDIVTDALTAFGMGAGDAVGFADLLASASANANTNVEMMGESFKYVAPVMGALGVTADDTALALGLMANAGIKGSQAGTQLRSIMNNLVDPTDKQAAAMKKYGVELVKNADGSVDLSGTMVNLREALGDLDEEQQAAAASTLFGREAMAGSLAIINASEEEFNKLTKATTDYDGAAKDMADTMQDNLAGSLESMKSKLEEAGIALAENLIPMMEKGVEWISNMIDKFNALDDSQKENIVKWGLMAITAGPALRVLGTGISTVGGLATGVGKLAGIIGGASGAAGLTGALSALGPLAIGGVAIAGIVGISKVVKKLRDDSEDLVKINTDVGDSFAEQANDLNQNIATFENLSEKSNVTNDHLARMYELNQLINNTDSSSEIERLQAQYDKLADKTHLSNEELEQLFEANRSIIEQSPEVETAINKQGEEFVVSTEKAKEYADSLNRMSEERINLELEKALRNEQNILEENIGLEKIRNNLLEDKQGLQDMVLDGIGDTSERLKEINKLMWEGKLSQEEENTLILERRVLTALERGDQELAYDLYDEYLELYGEELDSIEEKLQKNNEELEKVDILLSKKADLILAELEIFETGKEGLKVLDDRLVKNQEEIDKLNEIREANGKLTKEEQERLSTLESTNISLEEGKIKILEETGLYTDLNELVRIKAEYADASTQSVIDEVAELAGVEVINNNILDALDEKSTKLEDNLFQLQLNREEEGANKEAIDMQIASLETKLGQQAESKRIVLEELGIWDSLDQKTQENIINESLRGQESSNTLSVLRDQEGQIGENNVRTKIGINLERDRTAEAGKDVSKNVNVSDNGTISSLNKRARRPVSKVINFIGRGLENLKFWADGTPPAGHPGGLAVVGDGGGEELITTPQGLSFLSPPTDTVMNLEKGTHVLSHTDTKNLLRNLPKYAQGTSGANNLFRPTPSDTRSSRQRSNSNSSKVEHTGTIRVEGVNNRGELVAVVEQGITEKVIKDNKRLPNRTSVIPIG